MKNKEKITMGYHCHPSCPYLDSLERTDELTGKCNLLNKEIYWHDFFIAICEEDEDEDSTENKFKLKRGIK